MITEMNMLNTNEYRKKKDKKQDVIDTNKHLGNRY